MKKTTTFILAACLSIPVFAMPMAGDRMVERLGNKLDLTEEQKVEVKSIFDSKKPQMEALWKQMDALKKEVNSEVKSVLTPEQAEKFAEMEEERMNRRKHFMNKHQNK